MDGQFLLVSFDALSRLVLMNLVCGLLISYEFKSVKLLPKISESVKLPRHDPLVYIW